MTSTTLIADRYRLVDRIAIGGVGEVWRGADTVLARPVAVKLLRAEYTQHAETLARFRAEARHAGSLSHPAIAQIYDYGEADPPHPPYLVMELVDGPSLAELLAAGPLNPAAAMDVIAQAAGGLCAAHRAGLVHRDIKPANLLVGPVGHVKITDFGIVHAAASAPLTLSGLVVGTPAYLAPEQVSGAKATPATDLYALGVVAYECLAGRQPFSGTPMEVAAAHQGRPIPPLPGTVPAEVAGLVAELTAKDPVARPGSAADVAARAAQLRDSLRDGATVRQDAGPLEAGPLHAAGLFGRAGPTPPPGPLSPAGAPYPADAPAEAPGSATRTLAAIPLPDPPSLLPPRRLLRGDRRRTARVVTLAVAVIAVGATGLLAGGALRGTSPPPRAAAPAPHVSHSPRLVDVSSAALVGQPVSSVARQLRGLGFVVRVLWQPDSGHPAGTVLTVLPSGRVPAGSVITVTGAQRVQGKVHDRGNGHGHGGGDGAGGQG